MALTKPPIDMLKSSGNQDDILTVGSDNNVVTAPTHKCSVISHRLLKMSIVNFYKPLLVLCSMLLIITLAMEYNHESIFKNTSYTKTETKQTLILGIWSPM